jgi:hypothetical protein
LVERTEVRDNPQLFLDVLPRWLVKRLLVEDKEDAYNEAEDDEYDEEEEDDEDEEEEEEEDEEEEDEDLF